MTAMMGDGDAASPKLHFGSRFQTAGVSANPSGANDTLVVRASYTIGGPLRCATAVMLMPHEAAVARPASGACPDASKRRSCHVAGMTADQDHRDNADGVGNGCTDFSYDASAFLASSS